MSDDVTIDVIKAQFDRDERSLRRCIVVKDKPTMQIAKLHEFFDKVTDITNALGFTNQQAAGVLFALAALRADLHNGQGSTDA